MKNLIFLFIFLASCAPNISRKINQTKSAFGDKCKGVNSLTWQEQVQGADAATTAKLISDLTAAAEADAKKSEGLKGSVKADLNIKSELAKVINRNTTQSSKVSEEFWQQEIRFGESVCLFLSLLDRKDLSTKLKENIINDIRKLVTSYSDYELNRNSNKSQGYLNNSVINNGSQIKEQNTLITIGENNSSNGSTYINNGGIMATGGSSISNASVNVGNLIINPAAQNLKNEEKSQLLSLVKSELSKYGGDFNTTIIYVNIPSGHSDADEISLATDIRKYLKEQGGNVQIASFQNFIGDCDKIKVLYKGGKAMVILVCLPIK